MKNSGEDYEETLFSRYSILVNICIYDDYLHSSANPNLSKKGVTDMLYDHLKVTKNEAIYRLNSNYKSDIQAYDTILDHILRMSDAISEAIIKQFPDKFSK